jgi:hypothetical protein
MMQAVFLCGDAVTLQYLYLDAGAVMSARQLHQLERVRFELNHDRALSFVLTRFLHANRYPLRSKTL